MKKINELVKGNIKVIEEEFVGKGIVENELKRRFIVKKITRNGAWRTKQILSKGKNSIEQVLDNAFYKYN